MKSCSYCGCQNEDTQTHCRECGTEFPRPEQVDPQLTNPADSLMVVATFGDLVEASLVKDRLELGGIEACIPEELNPSPFGNFVSMAQGTGQVRPRITKQRKRYWRVKLDRADRGPQTLVCV